MTVFRVHYTENSVSKTRDVSASTAEQARQQVKPAGANHIHILKVKVLKS